MRSYVSEIRVGILVVFTAVALLAFHAQAWAVCANGNPGEDVIVTLYDSYGDGNSGSGWIKDADDELVLVLPDFDGYELELESTCLPYGDYTLRYDADSFPFEFSFLVEGPDGEEILAGGANTDLSFSIVDEVLGCTNPNAVNHDPASNTDDGSCEYDCSGTLVSATLHDDFGDGSSGVGTITEIGGDLVYQIDGFEGYTHTSFLFCLQDGEYEFTWTFAPAQDFSNEFSFSINTQTGDIVVEGDGYDYGLPSISESFSISAGAVYGCMLTGAENYDPAATVDDGSCVFLGGSCEHGVPTIYGTNVGGGPDQWFKYEGLSPGILTISSCVPGNNNADHDTSLGVFANCDDFSGSFASGALVFNGDAGLGECPTASFTSKLTFEVEADTTYYLFWDNTIYGPNLSFDFTVTLEPYATGCTDPNAFNYDPAANLDDGSCIVTWGCNDENAINYNPDAVFNNGTCDYNCSDEVISVHVDGNGLEGGNHVLRSTDGLIVYDLNGLIGDEPVHLGPYCLATGDYQVELDFSWFLYTADVSITQIPSGSTVFTETIDGAYPFANFSVGEPYGCTDELAINYDPLAVTENNTCSLNSPQCIESTTVGVGTHQATGEAEYFTVMPENDGHLRITSCINGQSNGAHDTELEVYADCTDDAQPIAESADAGFILCPGHSYGSRVVVPVTAGEPVYILWVDTYNPAPFAFSVTETDCIGVVNGGSQVDVCGLCNGAGNTCDDCLGVPAGSAELDDCGVCNGTGMQDYYSDADEDGYGFLNLPLWACSDPPGYVTNSEDLEPDSTCDIEAVDVCGICDGPGPSTWYADTDEDGLGDATSTVASCLMPEGYVLNMMDDEPQCATNDTDACGICAGPGPAAWYADTDNDGMGDPNDSQLSCSQPDGYVANMSDTEPQCSTNDSDICGVCGGNDEPGTGTCDCTGEPNGDQEIDACGVCGGPGPATWYADTDDDGLGDPDESQESCNPPDGYVENADDLEPECATNDSDVCGVCAGPGESVWYEDTDGDGAGDPDSSQQSCEQPDGFVDNGDDPEPDCATDDTDDCGVCGGDGTSCLPGEDVSDTEGVSSDTGSEDTGTEPADTGESDTAETDTGDEDAGNPSDDQGLVEPDAGSSTGGGGGGGCSAGPGNQSPQGALVLVTLFLFALGVRRFWPMRRSA